MCKPTPLFKSHLYNCPPTWIRVTFTTASKRREHELLDVVGERNYKIIDVTKGVGAKSMILLVSPEGITNHEKFREGEELTRKLRESISR